MKTNRFYNYKYPKKDSVVIVKVKEVKDCGINVVLLEYGEIEGMIVIQETSRSNFDIINKYKMGEKIFCKVLNVDEGKGFIDLTKIKLTEERFNKLYKKYKITKKIVDLISSFVEMYCNDIIYTDFMEKTLWKLCDDNYYKIIIKCIKEDNMQILNCFNINNLEEFKKMLKLNLSK
jgi:translation initiation factor 2 alpha subunit (eIF-2alpha)